MTDKERAEVRCHIHWIAIAGVGLWRMQAISRSEAQSLHDLIGALGMRYGVVQPGCELDGEWPEEFSDQWEALR